MQWSFHINTQHDYSTHPNTQPKKSLKRKTSTPDLTTSKQQKFDEPTFYVKPQQPSLDPPKQYLFTQGELFESNYTDTTYCYYNFVQIENNVYRIFSSSELKSPENVKNDNKNKTCKQTFDRLCYTRDL